MRTRRLRSQAGLSLVQVALSATLTVVVLGGASAMVQASNGVSQSTTDLSQASNRADHALDDMSDALRRGSVASILHLDGSYFASGGTDSGFKLRVVKGFVGAPVLSSQITYRLSIPSGAAEGSLVRTQDGIDRLIARGVTGFSISRNANLFTLDIRTRSGPTDNRGRAMHAIAQIAARNP